MATRSGNSEIGVLSGSVRSCECAKRPVFGSLVFRCKSQRHTLLSPVYVPARRSVPLWQSHRLLDRHAYIGMTVVPFDVGLISLSVARANVPFVYHRFMYRHATLCHVGSHTGSWTGMPTLVCEWHHLTSVSYRCLLQDQLPTCLPPVYVPACHSVPFWQSHRFLDRHAYIGMRVAPFDFGLLLLMVASANAHLSRVFTGMPLPFWQ